MTTSRRMSFLPPDSEYWCTDIISLFIVDSSGVNCGLKRDPNGNNNSRLWSQTLRCTQTLDFFFRFFPLRLKQGTRRMAPGFHYALQLFWIPAEAPFSTHSECHTQENSWNPLEEEICAARPEANHTSRVSLSAATIPTASGKKEATFLLPRLPPPAMYSFSFFT